MTLPAPVARYIDAYNALNVDRMIAELAEEVTFRNISDGDVAATVTGREAFRYMAMASAVAFAKRRLLVRQAITVAEVTALTLEFTATVAQDLPNGWVKGQALRLEGRALYELSGDKIIRIIDEA